MNMDASPKSFLNFSMFINLEINHYLDSKADLHYHSLGTMLLKFASHIWRKRSRKSCNNGTQQK